MATKSVSKAAAELLPSFRRNFKKGGKQVYLPNHVITFIRPKPKQPPNLATFVVPLTFNKLDLRDYLFHAYKVRVTGVRSFINEKKPERKNGGRGPWYRPRSQKMMIAELVDPFVWPDPPEKTAEARSDFDYEMYLRSEKERNSMIQKQKNQMKSIIPMRDEQAIPKEVRLLRSEAGKLLSEQTSWTGKALLDEGEGQWVEVEQEVKVPRGKQGAVEEPEVEEAVEQESKSGKDQEVVGEDQSRIPPKKDS
ncbi:hypothetical protein V8F20_003624 [Naviculisporaceae sp. PSN 640]